MTSWLCDWCGEENHAEDRKCFNCSRWRGTWICRWDAVKNCETAKVCRVCGMKKGTAPPDHTG